MPLTSQHNQLLAVSLSLTTGLNLQLDSNTVQVEQRLKIGVEDGFAGAPTLVIAPRGRERRELLCASSGGVGIRSAIPAFTVWYQGVIALITPGRLEIANMFNDFGPVIDWWKVLASLLAYPPNWNLGFLMGVELEYDPVIAEGFIEQGWDVSSIGWTAETIE